MYRTGRMENVESEWSSKPGRIGLCFHTPGLRWQMQLNITRCSTFMACTPLRWMWSLSASTLGLIITATYDLITTVIKLFYLLLRYLRTLFDCNYYPVIIQL